MVELNELKRDYYELLMSDMIDQFKLPGTVRGKMNTDEYESKSVTDLLLKHVLAPQLNDLFTAIQGLVLDEKLTPFQTPPRLDDDGELAEGEHGAIGVNLDNLGDVLRLTRKEAGVLSGLATTDFDDIDPILYNSDVGAAEFLEGHESQGILPFKVLDDDRYRKYLWFKIFLNQSYCTYPEMMQAISWLWDVEGVHYTEDVESGNDDKFLHATVMLSTENIEPGNQNQAENDAAKFFFIAPVIKAAGVTILKKATTTYDNETGTIYMGGAFHQPFFETTLPPISGVQFVEGLIINGIRVTGDDVVRFDRNKYYNLKVTVPNQANLLFFAQRDLSGVIFNAKSYYADSEEIVEIKHLSSDLDEWTISFKPDSDTNTIKIAWRELPIFRGGDVVDFPIMII